MKKIFSLCVVLMMFIALTGCDRPEIPGGEAIQHDKTQLYVSNFNGGVGTEWLYKVKKIYEELHAEDSYEEGKKVFKF